MDIGGLMKINAKAMWEGLGNNKAQRFRRFFLILLLIAGVTIYGFKSDAINIKLGFGVSDGK